MGEVIKTTTMTDEEIKQQAELEAAADNVASGERVPEEEKEKVDENTVQEDVQDEEKNNPYLVVFHEAYPLLNADGKTEMVKELDMSKILNLTTVDLEVFDRVLRQLEYNPFNKYKDTTYCKHVAMRVTGLPVEFFNNLKAHDMNSIIAVVYYYFLVG